MFLGSTDCSACTQLRNFFSLFHFLYSIYLGKKSSWSCRSVGYYGDTPCQDAAFSQDGSLLAVAYNQVCFKDKKFQMATRTILLLTFNFLRWFAEKQGH